MMDSAHSLNFPIQSLHFRFCSVSFELSPFRLVSQSVGVRFRVRRQGFTLNPRCSIQPYHCLVLCLEEK